MYLYSTNMTNQIYFLYMLRIKKEIRHFRNEKETGPNKVSKRLLGPLLGTTKKINQLLTGSSPVTFPETSAGRSSAPVPFCLLPSCLIEGKTKMHKNRVKFNRV